jgi:hypothetical protein
MRWNFDAAQADADVCIKLAVEAPAMLLASTMRSSG